LRRHDRTRAGYDSPCITREDIIAGACHLSRRYRAERFASREIRLEELEQHSDFRVRVRKWLGDNLPADWKSQMLGASDDDFVKFQKCWFHKLREGGLATPHWPREWGGGGMSFAEQIVLYQEIARAGAPRLILYFIALHHVPATLLKWGTAKQRQKHLPAILGGDEIWCQGFSEPNAGSDLASLKTRAVRDGDHYVVNGQKTWSSNAHHAKYCLLLARTDAEAPKHKGISYFILDMKSPGVTLKPIKQMTGESHFNEIFLDNVRIPRENLIGAENNGWAVAMSTLASERGLSVLELAERMRYNFQQLLDLAKNRTYRGKTLLEDDEIRRDLVTISVRIRALGALVNNMLTRMMRDDSTSVEPSIIKLFYSDLLRDFTALGVKMSELDGQQTQPILMGGGNETGNWMHDYLYSWAWSISGGSSEIQRNIIAERGLGLPKEPRTA